MAQIHCWFVGRLDRPMDKSSYLRTISSFCCGGGMIAGYVPTL